MTPRRTTRISKSFVPNNQVQSMIRRASRDFTVDESLPAIVVENRLRRAQDRLREALVSRGSPKISPELQGRLESIVKDWAARSFEDAFRPIEEFEIECARERDLTEAEASGDPERILAVLESRFRRHVIEQYGSVELRGIQISHRVILDLEEVYVPLQLFGEPISTVAKDGWVPLWTKTEAS